MGGRGRRISEFKASLVYRVSSRTVRTTEKLCLKNKTKWLEKKFSRITDSKSKLEQLFYYLMNRLSTKTKQETEKDTSYSSKEKIYQEDISILNIYAPNAWATIFVKETLLKFKLHIEPHLLIVLDFNSVLSSINRSSRPINKQTNKQTNRDTISLSDVFN